MTEFELTIYNGFAVGSWFGSRAPIKNNPEQEVQDYFWQGQVDDYQTFCDTTSFLRKHKHNGLLASRDGTVSFNVEEIAFSPKECEAIRVFMKRPEELPAVEYFTDPLANVFNSNKKFREDENIRVSNISTLLQISSLFRAYPKQGPEVRHSHRGVIEAISQFLV